LETRRQSWRGNLAAETRAYRDWLQEALIGELRPISLENESAWTDQLEEAGSHINRIVRAFKDRFAGRVQQVLGLTFSGATFEARIHAPDRPDIRIGRTFDTPLDLIWFLVPMTIFRPLVHGHFRRAIAWESEKHLYRLASQYAEAINRSLSQTVDQARTFMRGELETLSRLLAREKTDSESIRKALESIDDPCEKEPDSCAS